MASVVNSKLLYAAPVWKSALNNHAIQKKLLLAQRGVVLSIVSEYRTVSTSAVLVLASVPPIDLLVEESKETFQFRKILTCITNLQEIARAKEAIRKDGRRRFVENKKMQSTHFLSVPGGTRKERLSVGQWAHIRHSGDEDEGARWACNKQTL